MLGRTLRLREADARSSRRFTRFGTLWRTRCAPAILEGTADTGMPRFAAIPKWAMLVWNQQPLPCESGACSFATVRRYPVSAFLGRMARCPHRGCSLPFAPVVVKVSSAHGLRSAPSVCSDLYSSGLWAGDSSPVERLWAVIKQGRRGKRKRRFDGNYARSVARRLARGPAQTVPARLARGGGNLKGFLATQER